MMKVNISYVGYHEYKKVETLIICDWNNDVVDSIGVWTSYLTDESRLRYDWEFVMEIVTSRKEMLSKRCIGFQYALDISNKRIYIFECTYVEQYQMCKTKFKYQLANILKIGNKSGINSLLCKMKLLGATELKEEVLIRCIDKNVKRIGEGTRGMSLSKLENRNYKFIIDTVDMNIRKEDVNNITYAWSAGYQIGYDIDPSFITIYATMEIIPAENNISRGWTTIKEILLQQELPEDWVDKIIEKIRESKED